MAEAVVTRTARRKMLEARAGMKPLPAVTGFAFGNGGDENDSLLIPKETDLTLRNELLRKKIDKYEMLSDVKCRYTCTLAEADLAGKKINEIALYDSEGDLIAIKVFSSKGKDGDMEMVFEIDDQF